MIMTAKTITKALGGAWHGTYGMALCPTHRDGKEPALKVSDAQDGGVVVHCFAGCAWQDVKAELRGRDLLPSVDPGRRRRGHPGGRVRTLPSSKSGCPGAADTDAQRRSAAARAIWQASVSARATPVEVYLASRGLTLEIALSIRFHPNLKHGPTGLYFEAMVCAVQGPGREIVGVHRTYLLPGGRGKAQVTKPRLMLGPCCGGAVRFARAEREMGIAEGIESGLSVLQVRPDLPVWATLSTSGLKSVWLPAEVESVVVLADGDEAGEQASQAAAQRLVAQGRCVRIARPPKGMDFNDRLLQPANVVTFPGKALVNG
jgi:hypothetical protein